MSFTHDKEVINPNSSVLLQFSFVRFNQHLAKRTTVSLVEPKEQLTIETKTFRDKLQPGAKEKWSFTVKNKKGVQAEVLASMYDASLDQFKPHNWISAIDINDSYYNNYARKSSRSFKTIRFKVLNIEYIPSNSIYKIFTIMNHFGFGLTHNVKPEYRNYLYSKIKRTGKLKSISGVVVDETNMPLPGAYVIIKGTTIGTSTDFDGFYTLDAKKGDIVTYSYVGYSDQEIVVQNSNKIDIALVLDNSLEEVVITALGVKRKPDEAYLRGNFSETQNNSYKDGDAESTRVY